MTDRSVFAVGDRVQQHGYPERRGSIDQISSGWGTYRVRFDEGCAPAWAQIVEGCGHFYGHELEPCDVPEQESVGKSLWRRVWIAIKVGRRVYAWWPGDWSRRIENKRETWCTYGLMIGASDD